MTFPQTLCVREPGKFRSKCRESLLAAAFRYRGRSAPWTLLKDRHRLSAEARADLDALISQAATKRTARAWLYREGLRAILDRKQINVVAAMLKQWCTNVRRSKSLPSRRRGSSR